MFCQLLFELVQKWDGMKNSYPENTLHMLCFICTSISKLNVMRGSTQSFSATNK